MSTLKNQYFTESELCRMMGLSPQTISRYVDSGRFEGVDRPEPGEQVKIKGTTMLTYPSGETTQVYEIARRYKEKVEKAEKEEAQSEMEFNRAKIKGLEARYGSLEALELRVESGIAKAAEGLDYDVWSYLVETNQ